MKTYTQRVQAHRRLTILRFLHESPSYTANASILTDMCSFFGVVSSRDQVLTELEWLKDQGLVTLKTTNNFVVATSTDHGVDVALGKVRQPGVERPRPGS